MQFYTGYEEYAAEQRQHGGSPQMFGDDGYIWRFGQATMENWQSEFLQLLTFVVLTTYLIHKGSHESKDTDDKMQEQLTHMEKKLDELLARRG